MLYNERPIGEALLCTVYFNQARKCILFDIAFASHFLGIYKIYKDNVLYQAFECYISINISINF